MLYVTVPHAKLFELRLDLFDPLPLSSLKTLIQRAPCILTLRSTSHGGKSTLPLQERHAYLRSLQALHPAYLDLEYPDDLPLAQGDNILLSYHNLKETPPDLEGLYAALRQTPAALYKIAVASHSILDTFRLLLMKRDPNLIAISLGDLGSISRILSPVIGNPWTYAPLSNPTLGQLPLSTLVKQYRLSSLSPRSALYGLIGNPVSQSISDLTHNAYFESRGIDAVYVKMALSPQELPLFLQYAKGLPFQGLSVTAPLKEVILPHLDEIDPEAQAIGAVNTLLRRQSQWIGYNTDGKGALNAIERHRPVKGEPLLLIGNGGAAKAIGFEAHKRGAHVHVLARTPKPLPFPTQEITHPTIVINATASDNPTISLPKNALILDVHTLPKITPFLQTALNQGNRVIYGYEMFLEQALLQFALWASR